MNSMCFQQTKSIPDDDSMVWGNPRWTPSMAAIFFSQNNTQSGTLGVTKYFMAHRLHLILPAIIIS